MSNELEKKNSPDENGLLMRQVYATVGEIVQKNPDKFVIDEGFNRKTTSVTFRAQFNSGNDQMGLFVGVEDLKRGGVQHEIRIAKQKGYILNILYRLKVLQGKRIENDFFVDSTIASKGGWIDWMGFFKTELKNKFDYDENGKPIRAYCVGGGDASSEEALEILSNAKNFRKPKEGITLAEFLANMKSRKGENNDYPELPLRT